MTDFNFIPYHENKALLEKSGKGGNKLNVYKKILKIPVKRNCERDGQKRKMKDGEQISKKEKNENCCNK